MVPMPFKYTHCMSLCSSYGFCVSDTFVSTSTTPTVPHMHALCPRVVDTNPQIGDNLAAKGEQDPKVPIAPTLKVMVANFHSPIAILQLLTTTSPPPIVTNASTLASLHQLVELCELFYHW